MRAIHELMLASALAAALVPDRDPPTARERQRASPPTPPGEPQPHEPAPLHAAG